MKDRKKIIEEIIADFQGVKNKIQTKVFQSKRNCSVTFSQWFVLGIINNHNNIGIKEISEMLGISSSAATQLVDGLVDNKYVVRNNDPEDRRALQLRLSPKGKKFIAIKRKENTKNTVKLFNDFSDKDLETFILLIKKINTNI